MSPSHAASTATPTTRGKVRDNVVVLFPHAMPVTSPDQTTAPELDTVAQTVIQLLADLVRIAPLDVLSALRRETAEVYAEIDRRIAEQRAARDALLAEMLILEIVPAEPAEHVA